MPKNKKIKPKLTSKERDLLKLKLEMARKRPTFLRQEWFRYKRLKNVWRKPRGLHSKMRKCIKYRPPRVKVGYRGPKAVRGLHPSGFQDVLVHNIDELEALDPKTQAARIARTVGMRKRIEMENRAAKLGIRVLNPVIKPTEKKSSDKGEKLEEDSGNEDV